MEVHRRRPQPSRQPNKPTKLLTGSESLISANDYCPRKVCDELIRNIYSLASVDNDGGAAAGDWWRVKSTEGVWYKHGDKEWRNNEWRGDEWSGNEWRGKGSWLMTVDWNMFVEAIEAGCPTCNILWDAVLYFHPSGFFGPLPPRFSFEVTRTDGSPPASQLRLSLGGEGFNSYKVDLFAPEDSKLCRWPLAPIPPDKPDVGPETKFTLIDSWLHNCRENHTSCCSYSGLWKEESTPLPSRVLDVSPPDCELRLYETHNENARYICLSHCWGKSQPLTTTRSTLEARKHRIPWDSVPRTFQDAVAVTQKLGVRFLWIDSLCIVQDDREDWKEQSSSMCAVYQNAFLTIAATRCEGCMDPLFPPVPRIIKGLDETGSSLTMAVRVECLHLDDEHSKYPLLTRGWVFQERLLSRRMLHFGYDEVFWECMESTTCECLEERVEGGLWIKSVRNRNPADGTRESRRYIWHELVYRYTGLKLTYISDRQAAILGLAGEMRPSRQGQYLAGLWEDSLIADLAWKVVKWHGDGSRQERVAPTWSWASVNGQCKYSTNWTDGDTTILSIQSPSPASLPDDRRRLSNVTLKGRLVPGKSDNIPTERMQPDHMWFRESFHVGEAFFHPDDLQEQAMPDHETVYSLALGFDSNQSQDFECGLVLRLVDSDLQLYERVGMVEILRDRFYKRTSSSSQYSFFDRGIETVVHLI